MKKTILASSIAVLLASGSSAFAASHGSEPSVELSANVAITSNYIFRGFSQTDNAPALQGGFDLAYGGFYAGIWGSNVDSGFYAGSEVEMDLYLGYGGEAGSFSYDLGVLSFQYPDTTVQANNTTEWHASVGTSLGGADLGYTLYYSDDFFGLDSGERHELSVDFGLSEDVSLGAYWATQDYGAAFDDYQDYGLTISTSVSGFDLSASFTNTSGLNPGADEPLAGEKFFVTVGKSF